MNLDLLQKWVELLSGGAALIAGLVTALWAYTKYIVERGLLPPVQFDVDCRFIGSQSDKNLVEILVHLKNLGTSTLIASDIRVDVLYLTDTDTPKLFNDPTRSTFGRLQFPHSLRKELHDGETKDQDRGLRIVPYDTFVQPGVDQVYTLITAISDSTTYILVWSSFRYAQHPTLLSQFFLFISRKLGLIQYTLSHATKPHTIERVFHLAEPQ